MRRIVQIQFLLGTIVLLTATTARAQSTAEAIDQTLPRMVKIYGAGGLRNLAAYGTGFLVTPEGHIATVWSHVLDADLVTVVLDDGRRYQAKVVGAEPQLDVAVLQILEDGLSLRHFNLDEAVEVGPGTRILGFSNMFKVATGNEPVSVLHGVVAARTELDARRGVFEIPYDGPVYIVDANTNNSGAGGGVITTRSGELVGMIGREVRNAETNTWINYAVPATELRDAIRDIIEGVYVARERQPDDEANPRRYDPLDFGIVMVPDVIYRTPAYVLQVLPGSPAAETDLQPDDLVLFVGDKLIQSNRMLHEELGRLEPGDTLTLIVRRGRNLVTVQLPVERKAEQ
ncbi:MAG: S1C family serine protease [Planctomycetaceae bacterium]